MKCLRQHKQHAFGTVTVGIDSEMRCFRRFSSYSFNQSFNVIKDPSRGSTSNEAFLRMVEFFIQREGLVFFFFFSRSFNVIKCS